MIIDKHKLFSRLKNASDSKLPADEITLQLRKKELKFLANLVWQDIGVYGDQLTEETRPK